MNEKEAREISQYKLTHFLKETLEEMTISSIPHSDKKDILIVVKDQFEYVKNCIDSIYKNTNNFDLYVWDNGSEKETKECLESFSNRDNFHLIRKEENYGFNEPNNALAKLTTSPYLILLNSDTEVRIGWDNLMIGFMKKNPQIKLVGYGGGILDENFKGGKIGFGNKIDYVAGWSVCMTRETYNQFGLFDEVNLHFAYCEDADLSLRIKESGHDIYALYSDLVLHYENRTVKSVNKDEKFRTWFGKIFESNHDYMKRRWTGKNVTILERNYCADFPLQP